VWKNLNRNCTAVGISTHCRQTKCRLLEVTYSVIQAGKLLFARYTQRLHCTTRSTARRSGHCGISYRFVSYSFGFFCNFSLACFLALCIYSKWSIEQLWKHIQANIQKSGPTCHLPCRHTSRVVTKLHDVNFASTWKTHHVTHALSGFLLLRVLHALRTRKYGWCLLCIGSRGGMCFRTYVSAV
jgi:hypothetical protein